MENNENNANNEQQTEAQNQQTPQTDSAEVHIGETSTETASSNVEEHEDSEKESSVDAEVFPIACVGKHDGYWRKIKKESEDRIMKMFSDNSIDFKVVVGRDNDVKEIDSYEDADKILSYIIDHSANAREKSCGIMSICEWLLSHLQLRKANDSCPEASEKPDSGISEESK